MKTLNELREVHYSLLTEEDIGTLTLSGVMNGYGPSGDWLIHALIKRLAPMFNESSANIHDFTYWQGGNEARRLACDVGFFNRLLNDSFKVKGVKRYYYIFLSFIFFLIVRKKGSQYYMYR